jgi:hypothetical protein
MDYPQQYEDGDRCQRVNEYLRQVQSEERKRSMRQCPERRVDGAEPSLVDKNAMNESLAHVPATPEVAARQCDDLYPCGQQPNRRGGNRNPLESAQSLPIDGVDSETKSIRCLPGSFKDFHYWPLRCSGSVSWNLS